MHELMFQAGVYKSKRNERAKQVYSLIVLHVFNYVH